VLTVPDVVAEVRNKRQIRRLCVLPFDLQVREPRPESIKHCVEFAKRTGDYASLSGIDLKVISLTYELEADTVGTDHLRTEPVMAQTIASKEKPEEMQDASNKRLVGWYMPEGEEEDSEEDGDSQEEEEEEAGGSEEEQEGEDNVKAAIEAQLAGKEALPGQPIPAEEDLDQDPSQEELRRGCAHRSHCGGGRLPMAPHSAVSSSMLLSRSCRITRAIRCTAFSLSPAKKVVHLCLIQALLEICLQTGRKKNSLRHFWLEN